MDERIETGSSALRAQAALFEALKAGRLRSGQFVSMPQLIETLGFPMASVREAVKHGCSVGLLETLPKRGLQVMDAGPEITRHCMDLRAILDQEGARRLIASGRPLDLPALRQTHVELRDAARRSGGLELSSRAIETDLSLHNHLSTGLANPLAEQEYEVNRIRIAIIQNTRPFLPNRIVSAMEEHLAIIDALEAGDAENACVAIREHYRNTLIWWGIPV
ncbi:MAG: GntR family transcriptional regulator [Rhizobiaceae bacterium]